MKSVVFVAIIAYLITLGVMVVKTASSVGDYCEGLNAAECLGKSVNDYKKHADKAE